MQTKSPTLLPILRSATLARLLAYLFVNQTTTTLSALADAIGAAPSTVKREIDQLEAAGIVDTLRLGRNRLVRVDRDAPFYPELNALLLKAFGPLAVLRELLAPVRGIAEAYVFGSWARRHRGEPGHAPRDIDVLVVGDPEPDDVYAACAQAERRLGCEVNATIVGQDEWRAADSPFLATVSAGPLVPVRGPE